MEAGEYTRMDAVEARMWWYRALHTRLLDALGPNPGGLILDAGCGTGGFLARLNPGAAAMGLEYHAAAASLARQKSGHPIARGSIDTLPFADRSFATVVTADVLCHAAVTPMRALAEIRRVLIPGGRVIVNMPAFSSLMSAHDVRVHNARRMSAPETAAMLAGAGFHVLATRYWNGLLLPLMIARRKLIPPSPDRSDVAVFPPWLDRILHGVTALERRLPFPLPAGGSVLAIAERPMEQT